MFTEKYVSSVLLGTAFFRVGLYERRLNRLLIRVL